MMIRFRTFSGAPAVVFAAVMLALFGPTQPAAAQHGARAGEWRAYGGGSGATRYSTLDQINASNARDVQIVWRWRTDNYGGRPEVKNEVTPVMVDGVLYATAGLRRAVVAIDAATGETLWMWRMDEGERGQNAPRKNSGRGVAFWSDGAADHRVYAITPGYRLVALHAQTGHPVETFGRDGVVDLKEGLDRQVDLLHGVIGATSPPLIINDVVVVGASLTMGLRPPSRRNVPGHVRGYDVRTGQRLWIFHTIPQPGEFGNETWEHDSWAYTGNTAVWAPMSADDELGYVYLPVETATGDYYGGHRLGDNLFATSLVCLDARTGQRIWHYQIVRHDIWDYDNPTAPMLADVNVRGRVIKTVVQLTKQSFAYVFDRVTGEPVWPFEERSVPPSDVPGERTAATQPFPTRPMPYDRQGFSIDDLIDFTPALRAEAIEIVSQYRMGPLFTPPSLTEADDGTRGTLSLPGNLGGANWEGGAFDPESGTLFVGSMTDPELLGMEADPQRSDMDYVLASASVRGPHGLPLVKPPYGRITAIDLNTGDHLWMIPNGDTPPSIRDHPALRGLEIPQTGKASRAGLLVTKTLLFAGEGSGGDPVFRAIDKQTGDIVAEIDLPAVQTGLPMTYMIGGRQFIVFSVGDRDHPAEFVALALP